MTVRTPPEPPVKGRGATFNPANRFRVDSREPCDDGWQPAAESDGDAPPPRKTIVTIQAARTIIARNDSPDIPFTQSINPYQGCEHGCIYCYARPSHAYLDLSPGIDFETRLFAKPDAARLLRAELAQAGLSLRPDRARHQHRSLPADRARMESDALDPRSAGRARASVHDRHQVRVGRARHRPDRADGGQADGARLPVDHDARPRTGAKDGAARGCAAAPPAGAENAVCRQASPSA